MNRKGFVLLDALLAVFIAGVMAIVSANLYGVYRNYKNGYKDFKNEMADKYLEIYAGLGECEKCVIEEDSSLSGDY